MGGLRAALARGRRALRATSLEDWCLALLLGVTLATCASPSTSIPFGIWGTSGLEVDVGESGAAVYACCGIGQIPSPLTLDSSGQFNLQGTFTSTVTPLSLPARYVGSVNGNAMDLTITLPSGPPLTFLLKYASPGIFSCRSCH
jgi:hypothetical protein